MHLHEILDYTFMQHAVVAGLLSGTTCAIIGVFVVIMRMSSIGICITHASFAGGVFAILIDGSRIGWPLTFSLLTAALIGPVADRGELSPDTSTGIIFSAMLGLSFLFLGLMPGARTEALNLFWGSILTVTRQDLWFLALVTVLVLCTVTCLFKEIQAVLCDKEAALAVGISATAIFYGILFLSGAVITASLRSVGGLLIYSLIINPAAAAYQLTYSLKRLFVFAALFGTLSCWGGLIVAAVCNFPAGATIVLCSTLIFLLAILISPKRRQRRNRTRASAPVPGEEASWSEAPCPAVQEPARPSCAKTM